MRKLYFAFSLLLFVCVSQAQLRFEVTGVGANQIPIAVASFHGDAQLPQSVTEVIRANLVRSGLFRLVDTAALSLDENSSFNANDWRSRGADALVAGSVTRLADGRFDVRFRLFDVIKGSSLNALAYTPGREQLRLAAHRISDEIYERLTGDKGIFSTRIAYVLKRGTRFSLQVADADGMNAQEAFGSNEPIMSPSWSPDGTRLAYVSLEERKPVVYIHDVASGKRRVVANFRGSNSAPAWSPDGRTLAVALTTTGLQQIYLVNADASGAPRRLTTSNGIDTEPAFAPDGQTLYFVSDRGGAPQIYRMPVAVVGATAQRVTFTGDYNVSPRVSPDGKQLAYVTRRAGRFVTAVMDLNSGQELLLTGTAQDESPSFAPNGRYLLYATVDGGRDTLAMVSSDGRVRTRLTVAAGDVREPAWGPFFK
jgi:TolB protein